MLISHSIREKPVLKFLLPSHKSTKLIIEGKFSQQFKPIVLFSIEFKSVNQPVGRSIENLKT